VNQLPDPTAKGFFNALFDLSFKSYIFPKVIKILFVIVIILAGLGALGVIAESFRASIILGIIGVIILAPLYFLLTVIFYRVIFEVISAVFTVAENTTKLVYMSTPPGPGAGGYTATGSFRPPPPYPPSPPWV
jgi:Domain of unknown function (DUF4282)